MNVGSKDRTKRTYEQVFAQACPPDDKLDLHGFKTQEAVYLVKEKLSVVEQSLRNGRK